MLCCATIACFVHAQGERGWNFYHDITLRLFMPEGEEEEEGGGEILEIVVQDENSQPAWGDALERTSGGEADEL